MSLYYATHNNTVIVRTVNLLSLYNNYHYNTDVETDIILLSPYIATQNNIKKHLSSYCVSAMLSVISSSKINNKNAILIKQL